MRKDRLKYLVTRENWTEKGTEESKGTRYYKGGTKHGPKGIS